MALLECGPGDERKLRLDTLYDLVTKVDEKLRDREDMSKLRQDVLETAMDGLNKVSRSAETSALADRSIGVAHQRMGDIYEMMSRTEETVRQYKLSLAIFDRLVDEEPDNDWMPLNQTVSYDKPSNAASRTTRHSKSSPTWSRSGNTPSFSSSCRS